MTPEPYIHSHARTRESDKLWCRHQASWPSVIVLIRLSSDRHLEICLDRCPAPTIHRDHQCRSLLAVWAIHIVLSRLFSVAWLIIRRWECHGKAAIVTDRISGVQPINTANAWRMASAAIIQILFSMVSRQKKAGWGGGGGKIWRWRDNRPTRSLHDAALKSVPKMKSVPMSRGTIARFAARVTQCFARHARCVVAPARGLTGGRFLSHGGACSHD
jgi:hypothetical protein